MAASQWTGNWANSPICFSSVLFCFVVVVVFWLPRLHCLEHNSGFFCLSALVLFSREMFGDETDSSEQSKASPEPPVTCKGLELMKVTGGHFRTFTQIRRG